MRSVALVCLSFVACGPDDADTRADGGSASVDSTSVDNCYAPDANLPLAETSTAIGCVCDAEAAVCIAGTALICPIGGGRWKAYADGPCALRCWMRRPFPSATLAWPNTSPAPVRGFVLRIVEAPRNL